MKYIGFIGTGVMGASMVRNLIKAGYRVSVYNRTPEKAKKLVEDGAVFCPTIQACVQDTDAVITMVGFPKDVEEVYFGTDGILAHVNAGCTVIDMTTTSPSLSVKIYEAARAKQIAALDAPVSGGDGGAKNGTLSIMVGGDQLAYERCLPVFQAMGTTVIYEGPAGYGQHTKMANQIAIAGTVAGVAEAVSYANRHGLDFDKLFDSISKGAAGSFQLDHMAPKMIKGDYAPGFYLKHFIKDMAIAQQEAAAQGIHLDILERVLAIYRSLAEAGMGDLGTQAIIEHYRQKDDPTAD